MVYGAKMLMFAPFAAENPEPAGALPNYGAAVELGELNKVTDTPAFNEAKAYGNNVLGRYVNKFKEVPIDVTILDLSNENAALITGAVIETSGKDLKFNVKDNAPYGGMAFFVNELLAGNVDAYKGVFYPKVKATVQGQTYDTMGDSIVLAAKNLRFMGSAAKTGDWKIESPYFESEDEAIAWVRAKLGAA